MALLNEIMASEAAINGFYPTPLRMGEKMLSGIDWHTIETVLEPSAGKGDLIDVILSKYNVNKAWGTALSIDCIELDPYLRAILKQEIKENKKFKSHNIFVVHDDFLTFKGRKQYDLIVLNPPFADGDTHLLKALEMQKDGGSIVCLLNAETLQNPYSNKRKVLVQKLKELGAKIEYSNDGFLRAERKTDVTVAIVKVAIPYNNQMKSDVYERMEKAIDDEMAEEVVSSLVPCDGDFLEQAVKMYNIEVAATLELVREYKALKPYIMSTLSEQEKYANPLIELRLYGQGAYDSFNNKEYMKRVRYKYWRALFTNPQFIGKLTSRLQSKYQKMVEDMSNYDFSMFNILQIKNEMNVEIRQGVENAIVELFEKLTTTHSWYPECASTIHYYNGWKSNKAHMIGKKSIIPLDCFSQSSYDKSWSFCESTAYHNILDLEKAMNYLTGEQLEKSELEQIISMASCRGVFKDIHCKYFDITLYKKGTVHIKYTRPEVIDRLNIYVGKDKEWLPPCYGKKAYNEMTSEEQQVVSDFHTICTASYEDVCAKSDFYLASPVNQQQLLNA